jgi:peptidoglycan/LPS O-acetylase OafA/YrhL
MTTKDNTPRSHYAWVDWARFAAAFAVLLTHARASVFVNWVDLPAENRTLLAYFLYMISRYGHEAVIVFFVLSGYLVGGKLIERVRHGSFDVARYATDRVSRIYVPYLPALVLSGAVWWFIGKSVSLSDFVLNIAQLQQVAARSFAGNDALWSLAYEFWFYVVGGAFALACTGRPTVRLPAMVIGVLALGIFVKLLPIYLICWIIGAVAYAAGASARPSRDCILGLAFFIAGIALSQYAPHRISENFIPGGGFDAKATPLRQVAFLVMCIGVAFILAACIHSSPQGVWARIERWGTALAAGSYTLYLTHYPVLLLCEHFDPVKYAAMEPSAFISFGLRLSLSLIVAWGFYWLFEKRTPQVRAWMTEKIK